MTRRRRVLVAAVALALAAVTFHAQLASAVVTRGDDVLRSGDVAGALRLYGRAMLIDPQSPIAADRMAFYLSMRHDRSSALRAIAVVSHAIATQTPDPTLLADRAFAELQLRSWRDAERDFARAGAAAHDARYEHFAARMALHVHDRRAARNFALLALADDPGFAPARAIMRALR